MPSTITDRLSGLTTSVALKAPCRVATTANITLSGTQTIDGVSVVAGDRVLVKNQTTATDNGIWIVASGSWTRSADFNGTFDAVGGTIVTVTSGTTNANSHWRTTGNGTITIGTDSISFERALVSSAENIDAGGPFFGSTITDDVSVETALQELETAVETKAPNAFSHASTYAAGTIGAKLQQFVDPMDEPYGADGNGSTDDTAAVQAAIDDLPTTGGTVWLSKVHLVTGVRLDGSGGAHSNITICGSGGLKLAANVTGNVIRTASGSGFRITGISVEGNRSRGGTGVPGPTRGFWVTGTSYTVGDTVEVSSSDAATTTVAASNLVYECTQNHTAGATFAGDKAANWTLSTDANFNTSDISYATRNCIYLDGCTESQVDNCRITDAVYAGVNVGTGPVQAANAGPGSSYIRVVNNTIEACTNGIAGGKQTNCIFGENSIKGSITYGIVSDDPASSGNVIEGNTINGCGSHGIYLYGCDVSAVNDNAVTFCSGVGILLDSAAASNPIDGNVVSNCLQGILAFNSSIALMSANLARACTQYGFALDSVSQIQLSGNVAENNLFDGYRLTSCSAFSLVGNSAFANDGEGGIYLTGCANGSVTGGCLLNNNDQGTPSSTGAGLRIIDSTNIAISGVTAYDSRSGGSKTQKYGVHASGTSDTIKLSGCNLSANATADFLIAGSAGRVTPDFAVSTAAAVPANFTADRYLSFVQRDGTTLLIPARTATW